ncbi:MAG: NAD(P)H-hydrate dehydratase [Desulfohalobiaceae bacterium]
MRMPLPSPEEMATWDRISIQEFGISGKILMENASREALHVLLQEYGQVSGKQVTLFAGSGNNGGDAFALARHLADHGAKCLVLHSRHQDKYQGETAYHLELCKKNQVPLVYLPEYNLDFLPEPDILVDGLLGTGFQGELRADYLERIRHINRLGKKAFVLALDIPSGLNGNTGQPSPEAVQAQVTVTFEAAKLGLFLPQARDYIGKLAVQQIGIPWHIKQDNPPASFGLRSGILEIIPNPGASAHKGTFGHVLVLGGSSGLSGAPVLAALGALRSGAGLVTVACPKHLAPEIKQGWPEIMTLPLGPGKNWSSGCAEELQHRLDIFDSVILGPGLGRDEGAKEFLQSYMESKHPPTVYDADALYWMAQDQVCRSNLDQDSILTPHPGEMARLCSMSTLQIQEDRISICRKMAQELNAVLLLKGAGSVVSDPSGNAHISPIACPSLAVGGSGDVLSGILGSLLARGLGALDAACSGAYWHGLAGERLQQQMPGRGNLAQEIANELPFCLPRAAAWQQG